MAIVKLNGIWQLRDEKNEQICEGNVPGSVIAALYADGKIGHPYYRMNEYDVSKLFEKDYSYQRTFDLTKEELSQERVKLVCEGLDTICDIFLNDTLVGQTQDMHRTYRFDVKPFLRPGENTIRILLKSVLRYIRNYKYREGKEIFYHTDCTTIGNQLIRKPHSQFGWDWGPELVDAGIFRDIYIEATSGPIIRDVRIRQFHQENGQVRVSVSLAVEGSLAGGKNAKSKDKGSKADEGDYRLVLESRPEKGQEKGDFRKECAFAPDPEHPAFCTGAGRRWHPAFLFLV